MKRIGWIDTARGMGILLVVAGHSLGGLIDSPLGQGLVLFRQFFFSIYTFHMPLFFLFSGLLVGPRIERGASAFVKGLLPSIVWPYFLWSTVQFTVIFALGSLVNNPPGEYWPTILSLPWNTVSQFWFLYALFWMHLLAALVLPRAGGGGLVLLALALKGLVLAVAMPVAAKLVCNHFLFYALGAWMAPAGIEQVVIARTAAVRAFLLPAAALAAIRVTLFALSGAEPDFNTATSAAIANLAWRPGALSAAVAGTLAVAGLASLPAIGANRWLALLGRMSMPIFILHVMFIAGTRIALIRIAHVTDPLLLIPVLILSGVIGPLLVERAIRPFALHRYLGF